MEYLGKNMSRRSNYLYEFGPFRLDAAEHFVWRNGEAVSLPTKVFELCWC